MKKIKKIFLIIREVIWPLLEKKKEKNGRKSKIEIKINNTNLKFAYYLAQKYFDQEEDRNKTIEWKSTILIGILSISMTVLTAFTKFWEFDNTSIYSKIISILAVLFFFLAYSISSIYYAYRVLQRKSFHIIGHTDFIKLGKEETYLKSIIGVYVNITKQNSKLINEKVDYMTMSQEYFIRAVILIFLIAVILVMKSII